MHSISFVRSILLPVLLACSTMAAAEPATTLNLMPVPTEMTQHAGKLRVLKSFSVHVAAHSGARLPGAADRFLKRLDGRTGLFFHYGEEPNATLQITVDKTARELYGADESYDLEIDEQHIQLHAATDIGALHGLETLLQLVSADDQGYYLPQVTIHDVPRFVWRGLMLDVARHFLPLEVVKRNIDGMAAVKLNVLHLHLSDNQGFRVESKTFPRLQQFANGEFFSQDEIRQLVTYADQRGIRVVPEFDLPAHTTAILAAYPQLASRPGSYQVETMFGIFDPVLDPTVEKNYQFLDKLFADLLPLFPDPFVHIGGDENARGVDWNQSPSIQAFMKQHQLATNHDLQTWFNQRLLKLLARRHRTMIGWEEILNPALPKQAVVQVWLGRKALFDAARLGYPVIMSDGFYIDLMKSAKEHYLSDPLYPDQDRLSAAEQQKILGGEATMWTELVTAQNVDTRIWPRTAAIAERLWSPMEVRDVDDMYRRLAVTSVRLEELGLTHISARGVIMRNLVGGSVHTEALQVLLDVVEPLKEYRRNAHDTMYSVDSPFTLFADAASADAPAARQFQRIMNSYVHSQQPADREALRTMLILWRDNHAALLELIATSPVLEDVTALSAHLSDIAAVGLTLLDSPGGMSDARHQEILRSLAAAREQGARTDLQVVTPIEQLVALRWQESSAAP